MKICGISKYKKMIKIINGGSMDLFYSFVLNHGDNRRSPPGKQSSASCSSHFEIFVLWNSLI